MTIGSRLTLGMRRGTGIAHRNRRAGNGSHAAPSAKAKIAFDRCVFTTETKVKFPPGLLEPGQVYFGFLGVQTSGESQMLSYLLRSEHGARPDAPVNHESSTSFGIATVE